MTDDGVTVTVTEGRTVARDDIRMRASLVLMARVFRVVGEYYGSSFTCI